MKKILVIDDEKDMTENLKYALEAKNYEVITACNGEEGLSKTSRDLPDLIMLDYMMPKLNGLAFIEKVDEIDSLKDIPMIILTGKDHVVREFVRQGKCQVFSKPFDTNEVIQRVGMMIGEG